MAFAPLLSDLPVVVLVLVLLQQLPAELLSGLSLAGGIFVLYLARGLWRDWRSATNEEAILSANPPSGLSRGVLLNLLSPGPYLFWTLVNGPILLAALRQSNWHGGLFILGFYGMFIAAMLAMVGLFHQARRLGTRVVRTLLLASIVILVIFAGVLLSNGVIGLVG